jgi:hypothetical protein
MLKTEYRVTDYTVVLPSGKEVEFPGLPFDAPDDNMAIMRFDVWKENLTMEFKKIGQGFGSKKPTLIKIESSVIA